MGNGIALGIVTNDGQLGGLGLTREAFMAPYTNLYGIHVGNATPINPSGSFKNIQQMAVTKDVRYSGIVTASNRNYSNNLFWYILDIPKQII